MFPINSTQFLELIVEERERDLRRKERTRVTGDRTPIRHWIGLVLVHIGERLGQNPAPPTRQ